MNTAWQLKDDIPLSKLHDLKTSNQPILTVPSCWFLSWMILPSTNQRRSPFPTPILSRSILLALLLTWKPRTQTPALLSHDARPRIRTKKSAHPHSWPREDNRIPQPEAETSLSPRWKGLEGCQE